MIIAHLINDDGGVGNVVVNLTNTQVLHNQVYVFTCNGKQRFLAKLNPHVKVCVLSKSKIPPILSGVGINSIYNLLKNKHNNESIIIHAHNIVTVGYLSSIKKIPLVCTIHGLSTFPGTTRTLRVLLQEFTIKRIIRKINSGIGAVIGVSLHTSSYYGKLASVKIQTIYNGSSCHGEEKIKSNVFVFAHVGDISDKKGWPLELKAFSLLHKKYPERKIKFIFAGRLCGYSENDIANHIMKEGLTNEEAEYLGVVSNVEKEVLYKTNVVLLASVSEGLPMCIVEAQSMGIPVIATNVGGIPEIIEEGKNGFLIERDVSEIEDRMERLLINHRMLEKMSKQSLDNYNKHFSAKMMSDAYGQIYSTILSKVQQ